MVPVRCLTRNDERGTQIESGRLLVFDERRGFSAILGDSLRQATSKAVQDAKAKILKIRHAKGTPYNGAEAMIQSFGAAVARPTPEIVGDFIEPIPQGLAKSSQGCDAQFFHLLQPCLQSLPSLCRTLNGPILEDCPQGFPLICDLPQLGKLLLQGL